MKTIQLDRQVLQNLYGDSEESMIEIFSEFLADYPEIKKTLIAAFESGNLTSLKRVMHFHGPSFMYLGLPDVAGKFKTLELQCSQVNSHYLLTKDFNELMQAVELSWLQTKNEMIFLKKAC